MLETLSISVQEKKKKKKSDPIIVDSSVQTISVKRDRSTWKCLIEDRFISSLIHFLNIDIHNRSTCA